MTWYAVSVSKSVFPSPVKVDKMKFSQEQTLVALLYWFAKDHSLEERLNRIHAFLSQNDMDTQALAINATDTEPPS